MFLIPGLVTALITWIASTAPAYAAGAAPSPLRPHGVSAEAMVALTRALQPQALFTLRPPGDVEFQPLLNKIPFHAENANETPMDRKVVLPMASLTEIPEWNDLRAMNTAFVTIRDPRFMVDENRFYRRPTWLYPDDGCFARAELMAIRLEAASAPAPAKIFLFGNLAVNTPNTQEGTVDWWYHVVVAYKFQGTIYVMDPSLDPRKVMTLQALVQTLGNPPNLEVAVCAPHTYGPTDPCAGGQKSTAKNQAMKDEKNLFELEWNRLRHLNRNPYKELGDFPPWKTEQPPNSGRTRN